MSIFDHRRLTNATLRLDVEGLRRGVYSDKYFENVVTVLNGVRTSGYTYSGKPMRDIPGDPRNIKTGDMPVEAQIFNRRSPNALIAGVDAALVMLRYATGYGYSEDQFVETWNQLDVEAVEDGTFTQYAGDPENVMPVIRIRGQYRDFALLETPILGVLSRGTRIATNVYRVLEVSNGKPVLFFPARFDLPEVQALDGYAYQLAVLRYNSDHGRSTIPSVSTDAQGLWWGGRGGGTMPHAMIAMFLGDTAEAMLAFAEHTPSHVSRIALVDFDNDCVGTSIATVTAMWARYRRALETSDQDAMQRFTLHGVRLDTSGNLRDVSMPPDTPRGVSAALVRAVRRALDRAWESWDVPARLEDAAKTYCQNVKIVVTGGFNRERIQKFEDEKVPVDIYGVGSTLLRNDSDTNTDHTMDIVRVRVGYQWVDVAKVGRKPADNPNLQRVDLSRL
jgi:nicotinate phosphoribosyltransferase